MDLTWVTDRIAVGGGIWTESKMHDIVRSGVTHIINMQIEFDDRPIAESYDVKVLWNPVDDDFQPKSASVLQRGVDFAIEALEEEGSRVFIHCAAGVHRAPMMTLAILRTMGWGLDEAMDMIQKRRPVVDFAEVYVRSVEDFMREKQAVGRS
ncbi:MAG: dual specificity protein phosphatase [Candidatus Angelobacter sp.]|jgi:protein-tyrosine phosphatase|nr:dual specificity protein phosphatase [Candidatus Angelobacter sp.]